MIAEILKTIKATILGLGMQIPKIPAQRRSTNLPQTSKNCRYERVYLGNYHR